MLTQTHTERTDAPAGHVGGIGIHHLAHQVGVFTQLIPAAGVRHRRTDHAVGMANQVFGRRLNRDIDVKFQGFKQHTCRPGRHALPW